MIDDESPDLDELDLIDPVQADHIREMERRFADRNLLDRVIGFLGMPPSLPDGPDGEADDRVDEARCLATEAAYKCAQRIFLGQVVIRAHFEMPGTGA